MRQTHVHEPGRNDARHRQQERRRLQAMGDEGTETGIMFRNLPHHVMRRQNLDGVGEVTAEHQRIEEQETGHERGNREQDERDRHHPGRLLHVLERVLVHARLAVIGQEQHAKGIKRRDEHAREHGKIGEAAAGQVGVMHRLDDHVLGEEPGERRNAGKRQ